ncbi:MAG: CHASE domain-containing protein, partial [Magnetococcales bacterium]|nr:CHASE domain-containing protein [Magnetococcales bacterium]
MYLKLMLAHASFTPMVQSPMNASYRHCPLKVWSAEYRIRIVVWLMACAIVMLLPDASLALEKEQQRVTAAILRNFPPLFMVTASGQPSGFAIEMFQKVADLLHWKVSYHVVEGWEEAIAAVRNGQADLLLGAAVTPDWEQKFLLTESLVTMPVSCFSRSDDPRHLHCDDLANLTVTVLNSGAAHRFFVRDRNIRLLPRDNLNSALKALLNHEADLMVAPQLSVLQEALRIDQSDNIKIVGRPWMELRRVILLRQSWIEAKTALDQAIREFVTTPQYRQLLQHYFPHQDSRRSASRWQAAVALVLALLAILVLDKITIADALQYLQRRCLHHRHTSWVVLLVVLPGTLISWQVARSAREEWIQQRFEYLVEDARRAIDKRMFEYEQVLRGGVGLFKAVPEVNRLMWRNYVEQLRIETFWPGIQGMGFGLMIPEAEKEALIHRIRAEGFPEFVIHPGGVRPHYTPIVLFEPFKDRNLNAFGYDLDSEPVRHAALEYSRDTGEPSMTGNISLIQETQTDHQAGFLMVLPVYRQGMPAETIQERRAALLGFVFSPFRMNDFMRGRVGQGIPDLDFEIYDGAAYSPENLMYRSFDLSEQVNRFNSHHHHTYRLINLPGRTWMVHFISRPGFDTHLNSDLPQWILVTGLAFSLLLFATFRALARRQEDILD